MLHCNRALLAVSATLGMFLAMLTLTTTSANAGGYVDATLTGIQGSGAQSGTLDNGVDWTVDVGQDAGVQGYAFTGGSQTYTYDEPVKLRFAVSGFNCAGEGLRLPVGAELVTLGAGHNWDAASRVVASPGGATLQEQSVFEITDPVTSLTVDAVGAIGCFRGIFTQTVSVFRNATPTVTIAAPVDGGTFTQGQTVLADYSCADADTAHVDVVDCVGDVADGAYIDTSTTGSKSFTVTATDEHGATSSQTVNYTVKDQAGTCSGTALGLPLNLNIATANPQATPCVTRDGNVLDYTVPLATLPYPLTPLSPTLSLKLLEATSEKDGNTHLASAMVDNVKISMPLNSWSLEFQDLWSEVEASVPVNCAEGAQLSGTAEVGRIVRNGTFLSNQGNKPFTIPLPLLGGVHLNTVTKTASSVTANAVFVDLPGGLLDVNIGSSVAGVDC